MKNKFKKIIVTMMAVMCMIPTVSNANINYSDSRLDSVISELNEKYKGKTTVTIDYKSRNMDSFKRDIDNMTDDELYNYMEEIYINAENIEMKQVSSEVIEESIDPNNLERATQTRRAKVWCGIPALGHGYIHIKYTVGYNLSTRYFTGASVNDSWQTGITVGSWAHQNGNRTSHTKTQVNAVATGILSYGVHGTPAFVQSQQHFKYVDTNRNF